MVVTYKPDGQMWQLALGELEIRLSKHDKRATNHNFFFLFASKNGSSTQQANDGGKNPQQGSLNKK